MSRMMFCNLEGGSLKQLNKFMQWLQKLKDTYTKEETVSFNCLLLPAKIIMGMKRAA